jgi:DNA polymerase-3 subunit gamma/tau
MSEVLYRAYRPQKFADVVGQDAVVNTLSAQIKTGKIAHAYLFSGSRGTGKTSVARIFAHTLDVADEDIYEIDAASHTSVDDIRELNSAVHTLPFSSRYKVYILDEVHMLSKSASNALLKTLEEPPEHVIFILATTETHKIPETVLSRCEVYHFKKPTVDVLASVVTRVAKKEGYSIGKDSAELIALLGEGSFRDTLGTLQKVLSISSDKEISFDEVVKVTGAPKTELVADLVTAIAYKEKEKALAIIETCIASGVETTTLCKLLLHKLRVILLVRFGEKTLLQDTLSTRDQELVQKLATDPQAHITPDVLSRFLSAYTDTASAYIPTLPLELACIEVCVG